MAGQKLSTHSVMELLRGSCPPGEEPPSDAELALFANTIVGRQVACLQSPDSQATHFLLICMPHESLLAPWTDLPSCHQIMCMKQVQGA